jgi:arginine repressor
MKDEPKVLYATREAVTAGILELFGEQEEFKGQPEIVSALQEKGIITRQVMVSRVLKDLEIERNENGFWALSDKGEYKQRLQTLGELFEKAGGTPRLYSRVETVILRTEPNYNVLLAKQIAETFEYEVLSTFCPNEMDIVIYYQRRKKKLDGTQENALADAELAEVESLIQPVPEDPYKKSRMRIEIVKFCKKIRDKTEKINKKDDGLV